MALGEEQGAAPEAEPSSRWTCKQQEGDALSPLSKEQPPRLEAEGGPASPVWGAEGCPAPACSSGAVSQLQANSPGREPAPGGLVPPGEPLLPARGQMEEARPFAPEMLPQSPPVAEMTSSLCSGHSADMEEHPSRWREAGSPRASGPLCAVSSLQGGSPAQVASSWELVVPPGTPSALGPGPQLQWPSQPLSSSVEEPALGRRRLSYQAEYWACVLPDSLPPSPDRRSPLWNPNREYEELLDYTYPLRPGPQLLKHRACRIPADPALQDSGVDLDSFSVSPASTLKSPTNISHSCPLAEATALSFSGPAEPHLKRLSSRAPPKQGGPGLTSGSPFASTPIATGSRDGPQESREPIPRLPAACLPRDRRLELGAQLKTWNRPAPRPGSNKGGQQSEGRPGWRAEAEVESDDEYLALPTRLTQVSGLVAYLGSSPAQGSPPLGPANAQSSSGASDSEGPTSLPSDSSQSQLPSGATLRGAGAPAAQSPCFLRPFVQARDSAGAPCVLSSQDRGVSAGLLRAASSPLGPQVGGPPREGGEQGRESLLQCVKTFCCQLEELILWLYNVADITNHLAPPKSNLTGLKSSLQLYRQFKKDIDEHQPLTENVLQKGEILLQCLLDNTPVLKDVLERISQQPSALESHADHLYDSLLASLDVLAGCTLIPQSTPRTHPDTDLKFSLASPQAEI
ncbi:centrosomal protein of 68 kDa [Sorex fumeus]|uniref:centrosomal protein of 68 kDa n=1 Tax=Sorex fumeus TaxID=62283 RepID=UPI0024AE0D4F|nr:centrosomal protein of 68 kDa [Sorex fumeus]